MVLFTDYIDISYELVLLANTFLDEKERKSFAVEDIKGWTEKDEQNCLMIFSEETDDQIVGCCCIGQTVHLVRDTIFSPNDKKNCYKRVLFQLLSKLYPHSIHPWGILTGIRPVKIVHEMERQGMKYDEIRSSLSKNYYIHEEKIDRTMQIARLQKDHFPLLDKGIAIYISIPFCPSRCNYCSFFSVDISNPHASKLSDSYLDALEREMKHIFMDKRLKSLPITSVYVGGGTPSSLSVDQIRRLLQMIEDNLYIGKGVEFTFEAGRVDTLNEEKLQTIKNSSVTRISINPQTMNEETLKKIGRKHRADEVVACYHKAKQIGFDNINMDIILGLEDEKIDQLRYTLQAIEELKPKSLTVHTLSVKRTSKLKEALISSEKELSKEDIQQFMKLAHEYATKMGMQAYYLYRQKNMLLNLENTGYALPGKESVYNIGMMEERQTILAFGSGSISKFLYKEQNRIERIANIKDVQLYIDRIDEGIEKKRNGIALWNYNL